MQLSFIALFIPIFGQFFRFEFFGGNILLLDLVLPLIFGIWAYKKFINNENLLKDIKDFPLFWESFMLITIFSLSLFLAGINMDFNTFFKSGFYLFRYVFLMMFSIIVFDEVKNSLNKKIDWIKNLIIISLIIAILGFLQFIFYSDFQFMAEKGWDPHIGRLLSTWFDPNFVGSYFSFILSIILGILAVSFKEFLNKKDFIKNLSLKDKKIYTSLILIFFILIIALLLTFSRSALLAFVIPAFLLGIIYFRSILILGIIGLLIILPFSDRATERITDGINSAISVIQKDSMYIPDPTARLRVENFNEGLTLAENNFWTGIGFNAIRFYKSENINSSGGFDSSLLTVIVTTGIFGLFAFLFFYFSVIKKVIISFTKEPNLYIKGVQIGFIFGVIGMFAQSFFINSLFYSFFIIYVFGLIGVIIKK